MPEKVHKKFENTISSPPGLKPAKSAQPQTTNKVPSQTNGVKRSRDGSPKSSSSSTKSSQLPQNNSNPSKPIPKETKDSPVLENGLVDERPTKSKKLNGTSPKPKDNPTTPSSYENRTQTKGNRFSRHPPPPDRADLLARAKKLEKVRQQLPIYNARNDIRYALLHHDVLLLRGETGSGKTTQTPQFLVDQSWSKPRKVRVTNQDGNEQETVVGGLIAITQPRRVAALTLARRVAAEMGSSYERGVQAQVGHAVRFESFDPQGMKIKFVTEGTLLMELMSDPHLKKYSCVIVDEIHERSIDVDLVAGFLRRIVHGDLKGRGGVPLKVVVMSATFDLGGYESFFAKPGTVSNYKTGEDYGRIVDPELLEFFVDDSADSKQSRRSSGASFSSWSGISGNEGSDKEGTAATKSSKVTKVNGTSKTGSDVLDDTSKTDVFATRLRPTSLPHVETDEDLVRTVSKNGVKIEKVEGRAFPVQLAWQKEPSSDYLQKMVQVIMDIHVKQPMPGDILCFLTGQEDIETLQAQLDNYASKILAPYPKMRVLPLYGSLPMDQQQLAFDPIREKCSRGTRKVVLATNIAETSVTVPGVRFVVDCGKNKRKMYRPKLDMDSLLPVPISKVSAVQRMGRAGREAPGICYRIYTQKAHDGFEEDEMPEILRCDALDTVLKMKARGVDDVFTFPLMDSPDADTLTKALLRLTRMGALDKNGSITPRGMTIAAFPLPAVFGQVIMTASEPDNDVLLEAIDVIACLTSDSEIFLQPKSEEEQEKVGDNRKDITRREGDIITMLMTVRRYASEQTDRKDWCKKRLISIRAMNSTTNIRKQLWKHCLKLKLLASHPPPDPQPFETISPERAEILIKVFLKCFSTKTAVLYPDKSYKTLEGRNVITIHPSSVLHGKKMEGILFLENVFTSKNYAKKCSAIQMNWLAEVAKS